MTLLKLILLTKTEYACIYMTIYLSNKCLFLFKVPEISVYWVILVDGSVIEGRVQVKLYLATTIVSMYSVKKRHINN